jgi:hypothetical protein
MNCAMITLHSGQDTTHMVPLLPWADVTCGTGPRPRPAVLQSDLHGSA